MYVCRLVLLVFLFISNANAKFFPNHKKGITISPEYSASNQINLNSGDNFEFKGEVCIRSFHNWFNKKAKCYSTKREQLKFRAYFPDELHEVTDQVQVIYDKKDKKWNYSFSALNLDSNLTNTFSLIIGDKKPQSEKFLKLKAKFIKYIQVIDKLISKHESNRKRKIKNIEYLRKKKELLELLISRIDSALESDIDVLAKHSHSLMVDGSVNGVFHYSSNFSGFKLAMDMQKGALIHGESSELSVSISNLSHLSFIFPYVESSTNDEPEAVDDDSYHYKLIVEHGSDEKVNTGIIPLNFGQTYSKSFEISNVDPFEDNDLKYTFYKVYPFKLGKWKKDILYKWGEIESSLIVSQDNIAPIISMNSPKEDILYVQNYPIINGVVSDAFGVLGDSTFSFNGQEFNIDPIFNIDVNPIDEGLYNFEINSADLAGNTVNYISQIIRVDRSIPLIAVDRNDGILTNDPSFSLNINVSDDSPVETVILHNGLEVLRTDEVIFNFSTTLIEGLNTLSISSVDAAGNVSSPVLFSNIELDTIPPILSDFLPPEDVFVNNLTFTLSGKSNELLSDLEINGVDVLSSASDSFSYEYTVGSEGVYPINYVATDLAGNTAIYNRNVEVVLKVLNKDLISIEPKPNNPTILIVKGIKNAARANIEVFLNAGFFNSKTIVSNEDGSFEVEMKLFSEIELSATDPEIPRTDEFIMMYNIQTSLSGIIKDSENNPLPGVNVSIAGTSNSVISDGSGSFYFDSPITGEQKIIIDGSTIPVEVIGPNKKFSSTSIVVSIGVNQQNVIERPIYLAPLMLDGSETEIIDENSAVVVESIHAPGVSLDIPAGVSNFPGNSKSGKINVMQISSEFSSLAAPDFVEPEDVWAFEPSGLKFNEPVELTLPNVNEFPAGMQLVIFSKNSTTGRWEADGVARVDDSGSSIITEDGKGITHFSEVFAAPLGLQLKEFGGEDRPGANVFNGDLKTSISLPSYKALGSDISPSLYYSSSWANPNVVISNIVDVPRFEVTMTYPAGSESSVLGKADAIVEETSWLEPDYVDFWFVTDELQTEKGSEFSRFNGVPNNSLISYSVDMDVPSGVYPYISRYEIHLKRMVLRSVTQTVDKTFGSSSVSKTDLDPISVPSDEFIPTDLTGTLSIQNKKNSSAGSGWHIGGVQKIINPESDRIMLEEANGARSSYIIDNPIQTVYKYDGNASYFMTANIDSEDHYIIYENQNYMYRYDIATQTKDLIKIVPTTGGAYRYDRVEYHFGRFFCNQDSWDFNLIALADQIIELPDGRNIFTDRGGLVWEQDGDNVRIVGGRMGTPPTGEGSDIGFCNYENTHCYRWDRVGGYPANACYNPTPQSYGNFPEQGFADGADNRFNTPKGLAAAPLANKIVIADFGNNRVRELDLVTGNAITIAGNGQTYDNGDGALAINASIYHPQGVVYDNAGNLYVSSERGFIRKIDPSGNISTFAGKLLEDGAKLAERVHKSEIFLNAPYGMAIDENRNILYVADSGNHRVVAINMNTGMATQVAGNRSCVGGNIGDNGPALNASLCNPTHVAVDSSGNLTIVDKGHTSIRKVKFFNENSTDTVFAAIAKDNSKLIRKDNGSYERHYRNGLIAYFDSFGKQISSIDRVNREILYRYDSQNRLVEIEDPVQGITQYQYSSDKLSSITDPANRVTNFYYDGANLDEVVFPDGSSKSFVYDNKGRMTKEFNQRNFATNYIYNEWGRLHKIVRADDSEVEINDIRSASMSNSFDSSNPSNFNSIDDEELADGIKDARSNETVFVSDTNGYTQTIIDAKGRQTSIERDIDGRPLKIIRPDESIASFVYDQESGDLLSKSDSYTNVTINYSYDDYGNLRTQTNAAGAVLETIYDENSGVVLSRKNERGQHAQTYTYYDLGLLESKSDLLGRSVEYEYDEYGNVSAQIDKIGNRVEFIRDLAGNITQVKNAQNQITSYSYDDFNRLILVVSPKFENTNYEYLPTGELSKIIDPKGNETIFEYNFLGQLIKKTDPMGRVVELDYDGNGNVVWEKDPSGNEKVFEYDEIDQLVKKNLVDDVIEYDYDVRGNVVMMKNYAVQLDFDYDRYEAGDLVTAVATMGVGSYDYLPNVVYEMDYDSRGNRTLLSTSDGDFNYTYNDLSILTNINNFNNENYSFGTNSLHQIDTVNGPGYQIAYEFDNNGAAKKIHHRKANGSSLRVLDYTRDAIGNITDKLDGSQNHTYDYDDNNQLTDSFNPIANLSESFEYDNLGNRTSYNSQPYTYDSNSQKLVDDGLYLYTYDNNGNLSSKQQKGFTGNYTNYIHDSQNRLIGIDTYANDILIKEVDYVYDPLNRRVQKKVNDINTPANNLDLRYVYDGNEILQTFDANNELLATYTHSTLRTDDPLGVVFTPKAVTRGLTKSNGTYGYFKDHLGSITDLVSTSGNIVQSYQYSAFGNLVSIKDLNGLDISSDPVVKPMFTFTSREYDSESGLMYYRARFYDSSIGRFLEVDPHPGIGVNPLSFSGRFTYTLNNPINRLDPNGTFSFSISAILNFAKANASTLISGASGAIHSYTDARDANASGLQMTFSVIWGGAVGSITSMAAGSLIALGTVIGGPLGTAVASVLTTVVAGAGAFFHNSGNQLFYRGKINLDRSFEAAKRAAIIQGGAVLLSPWLGPVFAAVAAGVASTCVDNGILSDEEQEKANEDGVYCEATFGF